MSAKAIFLCLLTLMTSSLCMGQDKATAKTLNGIWKGTITQNEGYSTEYGMELSLKIEGDQISGRSYVYVDKIHAEMEVSGNVHAGSILFISDVKIINDEIHEGMEWCMKNYQLVLKRNQDGLKLEGHWQGKTTFSTCVPGKIYLTRNIPRA